MARSLMHLYSRIPVWIEIGVVIIAKHIRFNELEEVSHIQGASEAGHGLEGIRVTHPDIHRPIATHRNPCNRPKLRATVPYLYRSGDVLRCG